MEAPKEIYLAFDNGFVVQSANTDKDGNGNPIFINGLNPHKYIRSDLAELTGADILFIRRLLSDLEMDEWCAELIWDEAARVFNEQRQKNV